MGNISRNLILALSLVCVIILIVFCVESIRINRNVERRSPGTMMSVRSPSKAGDKTEKPDEDTDDDENSAAGDDNAASEENNAVNIPENTPRPVPVGKRYEHGYDRLRLGEPIGGKEVVRADNAGFFQYPVAFIKRRPECEYRSIKKPHADILIGLVLVQCVPWLVAGICTGKVVCVEVMFQFFKLFFCFRDRAEIVCR